MAWLSQIPSALSGAATVYLDTLSGGAVLGTVSKPLTITCPASVVPSAGALSVTPVGGAWGLYVQGVSRAAVSVSGYAAGMGASVASVYLSGGGLSTYASSGTSPVLGTAGTVAFTVTVRDSRGRTASASQSVAVTAYTPISITGISAFRANASGEQDLSGGTYGRASCAYAMTGVATNAAAVQMHWKEASSSVWAEVTWPDTSAAAQTFGGGELSLAGRYDVRFTVTDTLSSAQRTVQIGPGAVFMRWDKLKQAFGFGSRPEKNKSVQIADDWALMAKGRDLADNAHHFVTGKRNIHTDWNGTGLTTTWLSPGQMTNQPSSYGQILSIVDNLHKTEKSQLWFTQNTGDVYHRQGNSQGWGNNQAGEDANGWVRMVDADNCKSVVGPVVYPVGAIYMSTSSTSPASLFGGTWQQLTDVFLLAAGGSYGVGARGGEAYHQLTVNEMPSHAHTQKVTINRSVNAAANRVTIVGGGATWSEVDSAQINYTGANWGHNNMPPYYAVYMWRRTG